MSIMRRVGAGWALLALAVSAPATANCWSPAEREAAQIRELQTMLMVASLRCGAAGIDIVGDYNGFVRAARTRLETANLRIKMHFATEGGQDAYDRFTTSLANTYGDDATGAESCAEAAGLAREAAAATELDRLAAARLFPHGLPDDTCASASPAPIVVAALAPPAPPSVRVVTLPDEVVSALAVMARYRAAPVAPGPTAAPVRMAAVSTPVAVPGPLATDR